jgi:hypothetical protein
MNVSGVAKPVALSVNPRNLNAIFMRSVLGLGQVIGRRTPMDLILIVVLAGLVGATIGFAHLCERLQPHRARRP